MGGLHEIPEALKLAKALRTKPHIRSMRISSRWSSAQHKEEDGIV